MLKRALVTGASGTVGTALCRRLAEAGVEVATWDRTRVPIDDYHRMEDYVRSVAPDVLFHLAIASRATGRENESWFVNYEWTSELAWICRVAEIRFVFTSSVLVFSNDQAGPFTLESEPGAREGYGYEKRRAEERVRYQNPDALVVRLGWQIGREPIGNNMVQYLAEHMTRDGVVRASRRWRPACSFVEDTAAALLWAVSATPRTSPGVYMLDANATEGWTFFDIARAVNVARNAAWRVEPSDDFVSDQRMVDRRIPLAALSRRLPTLPTLS